MSAHHKIGWYQECRKHPEPEIPDLKYDPGHPAWKAYDDWEESHFYVGDDGILTCEENRVADACAECSERRCERLETWEAFVLWHGSTSKRDASGRFTKAATT